MPSILRNGNNCRLAAGLVLNATLALLIGCARQPQFTEVKGKVVLNDKVLAGAVVTFYPETAGNEHLPSAFGKTDAAGNYTLVRSDGQPGAVVGKHRVVVQWPAADRPDNWEKAPPPRPKTPIIPLKYTVAADTPLIFDVHAGSPQTIDLVLRP